MPKRGGVERRFDLFDDDPNDRKKIFLDKIRQQYPLVTKDNGVADDLDTGKINFASIDLSGTDDDEVMEARRALTAGLERARDFSPDNPAACWHGLMGHRATFLDAVGMLIEGIRSGQKGGITRTELVARSEERNGWDVGDNLIYPASRLVLETGVMERKTSLPLVFCLLKNYSRENQKLVVGKQDKQKIRADLKGMVVDSAQKYGPVFASILGLYANISPRELIEIFQQVETEDKKPAKGRRKPSGAHLDGSMLANVSRLLLQKAIPDTTHQTLTDAVAIFRENGYGSSRDFGAVLGQQREWEEMVKARGVLAMLKESVLREMDTRETFASRKEKQDVLRHLENKMPKMEVTATTRLLTAYLLFQEKLARW